MLAALAASLIDFDGFLALATAANSAIIARVGFAITTSAFAAVFLIAIVFISPLGRVRIGGPAAKPILPRWNWFAIALCTTIATGILFWGVAEPIFHYTAPPAFANAAAGSPQAAQFAISTLYMHWSITPYAIYGVPALAFALAYHNHGKDYSLGGPLSLVAPGAAKGVGGSIVDALALFALVAGVSASLGAGVLTLSSGVADAVGGDAGLMTRLFMTIAIVTVFILSSVSGLQKGIKFLSDWNVRFFIALAIFVFVAGPTGDIIMLGARAVADYAVHFIPRSLDFTGGGDTQWMRDWTIFNFSNWLAWAPITALFLGRIAVGYTVREFILFNVVAPATFGALWMTIFGGAAISVEGDAGGVISAAIGDGGAEAGIYGLFSALPFAPLVIGLFLLTTFVSFVTAMDSNTHSIASVCLSAKRIEDETPRARLSIKLFWGCLVGAVAFVMTATNGVDGVRMLSNLGAGPGLIILIGSMAALIRLLMNSMTPTKTSTPNAEPSPLAG